MSRIKLSFSLILTIILVGMLSTAVFASSAYHMAGNTEYNIDGTPKDLKVTFNGKDANDIDGTSFTVKVTKKDGTAVGENSGVLDSVTYGQFHGNNKGQIIVTGSYEFNTSYTVTLYYTSAPTTPIEVAYSYFTDAKNSQLLHGNDGATKTDVNTVTLDKDGSGLVNANETGLNNTRKNRSGQKVHGFYQNNTNSCASCHQTHTAANGESLLFKDGVYSTCSACHDGTTGAYNSFAPVSSEDTASIAGTFDVNKTAHNGSLHEADGSLNISAAPGGNRTPDAKTPYTQEFDCASCHAAHGSGSAGENNLNTDPMGWGAVPYSSKTGISITYVSGHGTKTITTTIDNKNGKLFTFGSSDIINGVANIPTTETSSYILVKTSLVDQAAVDASFAYKRVFNDPKTGKLDTTKFSFPIQVIQTYRWAGDAANADSPAKYVADYSLWNREEGYPYTANTVLKDSAGKSLNMDANLNFVWRDGFAYGSSVTKVDQASVSIGIDVETTDYIQSLYDSSFVAKDASGNVLASYITDSGTEMSKYCASCHIDYASTTRTDNTGVYTSAHRHATLQDKLTCVRCHYGHGTEAQIMHDANDNTYYDLTAAGKVFDSSVAGNTDKAISYLVDPNPTSALKRYTGMSVCYACHGKGEQFIGSNSDAPDKSTGEFLKGGDPGAARSVISK